MRCCESSAGEAETERRISDSALSSGTRKTRHLTLRPNLRSNSEDCEEEVIPLMVSSSSSTAAQTPLNHWFTRFASPDAFRVSVFSIICFIWLEFRSRTQKDPLILSVIHDSSQKCCSILFSLKQQKSRGVRGHTLCVWEERRALFWMQSRNGCEVGKERK